MKLFAGYHWPDNDVRTPPIVMEEIKRLPRYLAHVSRRRTCLQAGGNVGVYANALAAEFEQVVTVEPDPENWQCLQHNLLPGVQSHHACLGAMYTPAGWGTYRPERETTNYGATCVRSTTEGGVPMFTIDSWQFQDLDFLMLDIEGYEQPALEGAVQTLARCRPVIAVELKGLGAPHGWPDAMTHDWLRAHGYQQAVTIGRDYIYLPC